MKSPESAALRELVATLRRVCAPLPAAEEYIMVHHPAFRVGKKPFAIAGMNEPTMGATLSINLGRDLQPQLLDDTRFSSTPYLGQHGWVTVSSSRLRKGELELLVNDSWRRVATRKQLALLDAPRSGPQNDHPRAKPAAKKAAAKKSARPAR